MTPVELKEHLIRVVEERLMIAIMIWGPPGIGKSSIVREVAEERNMNFTDLRLSQLSPTDLRGLPVPRDGVMGSRRAAATEGDTLSSLPLRPSPSPICCLPGEYQCTVPYFQHKQGGGHLHHFQ